MDHRGATLDQNTFRPRVRLRRARRIRPTLGLVALMELWLWAAHSDPAAHWGVPLAAVAVAVVAGRARGRWLLWIAPLCHVILGANLVALIPGSQTAGVYGGCVLYAMALPAFGGIGLHLAVPIAAATVAGAVAVGAEDPAASLPVLVAALAVGTWSGWRTTRVEQDDLLARIELEHLAERLTHQAQTDPLTDLPNRQHVQEWLEQVWEQSRQTSQALSLLMVDIDRFKHINDTHGHPIGDRVIRAVAQAIGSSIRSEDLAGRWGGEEFVVVLSDCPPPRGAPGRPPPAASRRGGGGDRIGGAPHPAHRQHRGGHLARRSPDRAPRTGGPRRPRDVRCEGSWPQLRRLCRRSQHGLSRRAGVSSHGGGVVRTSVLLLAILGCNGGDDEPFLTGDPNHPPDPPPPTDPTVGDCAYPQVREGDWTVSTGTGQLCQSFNALDGDLVIDADPESVACLCSVTGSVTIDGARGVVTLGDLQRIGGNLAILEQIGLTGVQLPTLLTVGGSIEAVGNTQLDQIDLTALTEASSIRMIDNALASLELATLHTVGDLEIRDLGQLEAIDLGALATVDALLIEDNPRLMELSGITALTSAQSLRVAGNAAMGLVEGFDGLTSVAGALELIDNADLKTLSGFAALTETGALVIDNNPLLAAIDAFGALQTTDDLRIATAPALGSLPAFDALQTAGTIEMVTLHGVTQLSQLSSLTSVDRLVLVDLFRLSSVPTLPQMSTPGAIELTDNPALINLTPWGGFTSVGGLLIARNEALQTLQGLQGVTTVQGDLTLDANPTLTDVTALSTLQSVDGDVTITNNASLPQSQAEAVVGAIGIIDGTTDVSDNGKG